MFKGLQGCSQTPLKIRARLLTVKRILYPARLEWQKVLKVVKSHLSAIRSSGMLPISELNIPSGLPRIVDQASQNEPKRTFHTFRD